MADQKPPWDETIKVFFRKTRDHYLAVNDILKTESQTPAQMQKRWEANRQVLREFLTDSERQQLDQFLR